MIRLSNLRTIRPSSHGLLTGNLVKTDLCRRLVDSARRSLQEMPTSRNPETLIYEISESCLRRRKWQKIFGAGATLYVTGLMSYQRYLLSHYNKYELHDTYAKDNALTDFAKSTGVYKQHAVTEVVDHYIGNKISDEYSTIGWIGEYLLIVAPFALISALLVAGDRQVSRTSIKRLIYIPPHTKKNQLNEPQVRIELVDAVTKSGKVMQLPSSYVSLSVERERDRPTKYRLLMRGADLPKSLNGYLVLEYNENDEHIFLAREDAFKLLDVNMSFGGKVVRKEHIIEEAKKKRRNKL